MIRVHRAERADRLVAALADVLAEPLDDPMAAEVVAVPSRGIERWIAQELSARLGAAPGADDGVCANVEFPFPSRVIGAALAAVTGTDPDADPWTPSRLVWPLLAVVQEHLDEPWLASLRTHLLGPAEAPDPTRRSRRFGAVRHIADLYDRYAIHRPSMVRAWHDGRDVDSRGEPLPDDARWQAQLWRAVRERIGIPSPAERLVDVDRVLRADPDAVDLPPRLSLFGLTALPRSSTAVLSALAAHREVHLFLLHPSAALWERVARLGLPATRVRRAEDPSRTVPSNPLLASWGRDARELQLVVAAADAADQHHPLDEREPTTLLERIQADVRADRRPPGAPLSGAPDRRPLLAADDRSLQVHACHGRTRQVEVLRDAVLHLLADDPTLEPRDIIVMCPDIEAFAPIVTAVFGAAAVSEGTDEAGLPDLRVRLADRSLRQTNPLLRVVAQLLTLADSRVTASEVLDFASREPVRRRFRLDDEALGRVEAWVAEARIRWGLDAEHRAAFGLDGVTANTWRAGLDRILLGVTMTDEGERLLGDAVPLDDVEGDDVDVAGRFAELVDRLDRALESLRREQPITAWRQALLDAADALADPGEAQAWQRPQLARILDEVVDEAGVTPDGAPADGAPAEDPDRPPADAPGATIPLALPEVRALLEDRLRGRPTRANHRTGDLTVATLVPMRSVPHRVVCLLGMDDGAFPRRVLGDGDDLIDRDPHVGDRDARSEDRQLLLDALLAAGEHLVVTYTGRDETTNEPRPPAVPIGELLDVVDRTVRCEDGRPARDHVVVEHPLQPFDHRNFTVGGLVAGTRWGHDPVALAGARVQVRGERVDPEFLAKPLPPAPADVVDLDALVTFLQHPVRAFLRQRLEVVVPRDVEEPSDAIPVEPEPLDRYAAGDRLLRIRLAGGDAAAWERTERRRGLLPPGALADDVVAEIIATVDALLAAAGPLPEGAPESVEVDVPLGDGRSLLGTVTGLRGDVLHTVQYSRVGPKHRLAAWARLLAVTAAHPEREVSALTVGRLRQDGNKRKHTVTVARIAPLAPGAPPDARRAAALEHLEVLVDLYDRGMVEPLPLYCATSAAWAQGAVDGPDAAATAARKAWAKGRFREDADPDHVLALGGVLPFDALLAQPPGEDERGPGWAEDEPHRFGRYARRLWDGLLACESLEDC